MVEPLEEIDKTSKLILSLSSGALVLIIGFLKDPGASIWARLILGVSALLFGCSLFQWLTPARMTVNFREDFAQAVASDDSKELLLVAKAESDWGLVSAWMTKYGSPLPEKRHKLFLKFKSQCTFFVYGMLVSLTYLLVLLYPALRVLLHRP